MELKFAKSDGEILACLPVMKELRPNLEGATFIERVRRQMSQGYQLVWASKRSKPAACMGFREIEHLSTGKVIYIDDLVTLPEERSRGYGQALLDWAESHARSHGCKAIHLDSGTQRYEAHRFYFREHYHVSSFHFVLDLGFHGKL